MEGERNSEGNRKRGGEGELRAVISIRKTCIKGKELDNTKIFETVTGLSGILLRL